MTEQYKPSICSVHVGVKFLFEKVTFKVYISFHYELRLDKHFNPVLHLPNYAVGYRCEKNNIKVTLSQKYEHFHILIRTISISMFEFIAFHNSTSSNGYTKVSGNFNINAESMLHVI